MDKIAVAYRRVSKEEQALEGLSLEAQEANLRAYCASRGLILAEMIADPGVSAGEPLATRAGGQRLYQLIAGGHIEAVVAVGLDRLFRNAGECLMAEEEWRRAGVVLHLLNVGGDTIDTSTASGRFFLTVLAGVAEMERNILRERILAAFAHQAANGIYMGSQPLFGYRRVPRDVDERRRTRIAADFVPDPTTAPLVRGLFEMFVAGCRVEHLAQWLNGKGVKGLRGHDWTGTTISQILANATYVGMLSSGRLKQASPTQRALNVEPIVDPDLWQAAHDILSARSAGPRGSRQGRASIFAGMLVCGSCGAKVHSYGRWDRDGELLVSLRCSNVRRGRCGEKGFMEHLLWRQVRPLLVDALDPARVKKAERERGHREADNRRRLLELDTMLDRLLSAYEHAASQMTVEELHRRREPLLAERESILASQPEVQRASLPIPGTRREIERLLDTLGREELRALLQRVFHAIPVSRGQVSGEARLRL